MERTIGNGIAVTVGSMGGTVLGDLVVRDLRTTEPARDGVVRRVDLERVRLRYRLGELADVVQALLFPSRHRRPATEWLRREPLTPATVVARLHATLPESVRLDLSGRAELVVAGEPASATVLAELDASRPERLVTVRLSELVSPWWPGETGDEVALSLAASRGRLSLRHLPDETSEGVRIQADVRSDASGASPVITSVSALVDVERLHLSARAGSAAAELAIRLPASDRPNEVATRVIDDPAIRPGALDLSVELTTAAEPSPARRLAHRLVTEPSTLVDEVRLAAEFEASEWWFLGSRLVRLSGAADWAETELALRAVQAQAEIGGLTLASVPEPVGEVSVELESGRWELASGLVTVDDLAVSGGSGELAVDGSVTLGEEQPLGPSFRGALGGSLSVGDPRLVAGVLHNIGVIPALPEGFSPGSRVTLDFTVEGAPSDPLATISLAVESPVIAGIATDRVELDARVEPDRVTLSNALILADPSRVRIRGSAERDGFSLEGFDFAAEATELSSLAAPLRSVSVSGSGDAAGTTIRELGVDLAVGARAGSGGGDAGRSGEAAGEGLVFSLVQPATLSWEDDAIAVDRVSLGSRLGSVLASGSVKGGEVDAELSASGVPFATLVALLDETEAGRSSGTLSAEARVEGSLDAPDAFVTVNGSQLSLGGDAVSAEARIRQRDGRVAVERLEARLGGVGEASATADLPLALGAAGLVVGDLDTARVNATASFPRLLHFVAPDLHARFPESEATIELSLNEAGGRAVAELRGLESGSETVLAGVTPFTAFELSLDLDELAATGAAATFALRAEGQELVTGTTSLSIDPETGAVAAIGATGDLRTPLAELSHFVPSVSLLGGTLTGEITLSGDPDSLAPVADLRLEDALVKAAPTVPAISAITGDLAYEAGLLTVPKLTAELGRAPVTVSGSGAIAESGPDVDVRIEGTNALLARTSDLRVRADVDARLRAQDGAARLTGRADITDVLYTRPVQLFSLSEGAANPTEGLELFRIEAEWARQVGLDLRVVAPQTIVVDNNLYDGSLSADLTLRGTAALPRPDGRVFADSGSILFPTTVLSVDELELLFPTDSSFSPELVLRATTEIDGYEMSVSASGQIPDVEVGIVSSPPLPTDEALVLLTTGTRTADLDFTGDVPGTLTAVGTVVGRSFLNQLSRAFAEEGQGFFERLEFAIERNRASGAIGDIEVEYQLAEGERWYVLLDRTGEENYSVQLAWRIWSE